MARSPFYPFRNSMFTFEVEDTGSDVIDSSGNPTPSIKKVTLLCFMEPVSVRSDNRTDESYSGIGFTETILKGFLVSPEKMPKGINNLDKTVEATYQGQKGVFTRTINLPDPVGADAITGIPISGIFRVVGGQ